MRATERRSHGATKGRRAPREPRARARGIDGGAHSLPSSDAEAESSKPRVPAWRTALCALGLLAVGVVGIGQGEDTERERRVVPEVRFAAYDVFVDSGEQALGAWQVDVHAGEGRNAGTVKIVGIEGGEAGVYREPPVYDPRAMMRDRVIIGAYSTAADLPRGRTRVATIHVRIEGPAGWEPEFDVTLETAATGEGAAIAGEVRLEKGERP